MFFDAMIIGAGFTLGSVFTLATLTALILWGITYWFKE
jgi:hypothetical protein